MNKRTRGAFAMVLAGAVTFSAANALLATPTVKRLVKEHALTITSDYKKQDIISQTDKTAKDQTSPTNLNDVQIKSSPNLALDKTANQQKTESVTKSTAVNQVNAKTTTTPVSAQTPATTPAATPKPVISAQAPTTATTSRQRGQMQPQRQPTMDNKCLKTLKEMQRAARIKKSTTVKIYKSLIMGSPNNGDPFSI